LGSFAPEDSEAKASFSGIIGGFNTGHLKKHPQRIDFFQKASGKFTGLVLTVASAVVEYQIDESTIKFIPFLSPL
jgi:hypothetical protein